MKVSLNKTYNFRTISSTYLGAAYTNMKLKGILDSSIASKLSDIYTMHQNMTGQVANLPESADDLTWLQFKKLDNSDMIIAYEYLDIASLEEVVSLNITVQIFNTNTEDLEIIRRVLTEYGYVFKITTTPGEGFTCDDSNTDVNMKLKLAQRTVEIDTTNLN